MAYIPDRYSLKFDNREIIQNSNEPENSYSQIISKKDVDYEYVLILLLNALDHLSSDMALRIDIDPDYLFNKSLLVSSININTEGIDRLKNDLYTRYYWLIKLLEETATQ